MGLFRVVSIDWGSRFKALEDLLTNAAPILDALGFFMRSRAEAAFHDQGRPGGAWPERAVPNIPGIIHDFHGGLAKPKAKRFESRPAVIDTNDLSRSIRHQLVAADAVEIGVHGPAQAYADIQQFGGDTETLTVTQAFQDWLYAWIQTREGSAWRHQLGWLLNGKFTGQTLPWTVRARPFLVVLPEDVDDFAELTGVHIVDAMAAA